MSPWTVGPSLSASARRWRRRRAAGAVVAIVLVSVTLWLARPSAVWQLVIGVRPGPLAGAAAAALLATLCRGLRLALLLPTGRLTVGPAVAVAAAAQASATFVPARIGELALPALLRRRTGHDFAAGIGTLLAARTLDVAALGAWLVASLAALAGSTGPYAVLAVVLLLLPPLLLPATMAAADRLTTRCLAPRGLRPRRWARRMRRVRHEIDRVATRPGRLVAAFAASLATWAALWTLAWLLLEAMGHRWPWWTVAAGSAIASGSSLFPVNAVGNLGTLEAGWTAAFVLLGIPLDVAAATGLACHLWSLVFIAVYGAAGWAMVSSGQRVHAER